MNLIIILIFLIQIFHHIYSDSLNSLDLNNSPTESSSIDLTFDSLNNQPSFNPSLINQPSSINSSSFNLFNLSNDYFQPDDTDDNKIKWPSNLLELNYTELIKIDKNCKKSPDKCDYGSKRTRELDERDCNCEDNCKEFGNCCLDYLELNKTLNKKFTNDYELIENLNLFNQFKQEFACKELMIENSFRFLLVKSKCPLNFKNKLIRDKCELNNSSTDYNVQFEINYQDPFQTTPVTSTKTRITYSNLFCALCNEYFIDDHNQFNNQFDQPIKNDKLNDFKFWKVNVTCENLTTSNLSLNENTSFNDFIKTNFTYDSRSDSWLIEYQNKNNKQLDKKYCSLKVHMPDELQFFIKPCKHDLIDKCAPNWSLDNLENRKIKSLCESYQSRVSYFDKKLEFRNVHCAICNFMDINQLGCPSNLIPMSSEFDGRSHSSLQAWVALFDVNFNTAGGSNLVGKKSYFDYCPSGSTYDYVFQKCRDIICGFEQEYFGGECILPIADQTNKLVSTSSDNKTTEVLDIVTIDPNQSIAADSTNQFNLTTLKDNNEYNSINNKSTNDQQSIEQIANQFTAEFRKCAKISLNSGFMELKNDSIYLQEYNQIINKGNYNLTNNQLLICVPFSPILDKFEDHYSSIAYCCLIFSIICLTLYLIVFCLVPDLRNLSGRNLSSLCLSLIMVYFCFAIAPLSIIQNEFCKLIAYVKYYGLLASFCWSGVIAFDIYQTIQNSLNALRYKTGPQTTKFLIYSLICWSIPLLGVIFVLLTDLGIFNQTIADDFKPDLGLNKECWFSHRKALLIFFVFPVGLITILNLLFFLLTSKNLLLTTNRNKLKLSSTSTSKFDFNLYLRLFLLFGLTWLSGFLATYFDKIYLWYLFTLFNTLQGVFIFIAFGCKRTVIKKLKIKLNKLFLFNNFKSNNKNSSISTSTCRTPTNQSTITHLNSSNKILNNQDHLSLSKSFGDLYTKNLANNFYSTDSLNKHDYYQTQFQTNNILNQLQQTNNIQTSLPTTIQLHRQSTLINNNNNSPTTTFHQQSNHLNQNNSLINNNQLFKFTNYRTEQNNSQQMNKWFDW